MKPESRPQTAPMSVHVHMAVSMYSYWKGVSQVLVMARREWDGWDE